MGFERQIQRQAFQPPGLQSRHIHCLASRGEHTPAALLQPQGDTLTDAAWKLPPTPTARDGKAGLDYRKRTEGDDLYQAASRIGSSTPAPSPDGNGSSDVPLPFR